MPIERPESKDRDGIEDRLREALQVPIPEGVRERIWERLSRRIRNGNAVTPIAAVALALATLTPAGAIHHDMDTQAMFHVRVPAAADGLPTWTPEPTPLPTATPSPTSAQPPLNPRPVPAPSDPIGDVLRSVGWPQWAIPSALSVIACESGGSMQVIGAAGEVGVFQIHPVHFGTAAAMGLNLWTLEGNAGYALYLWSQLGWQPWSCQP